MLRSPGTVRDERAPCGKLGAAGGKYSGWPFKRAELLGQVSAALPRLEALGLADSAVLSEYDKDQLRASPPPLLVAVGRRPLDGEA